MRSATDRKIAGVCAGFAEYFDVDPTIVRVLWLIMVFVPVPIMPVVAYFVAWIVMPTAPLPIAPATAPASTATTQQASQSG